MFTHWVWRSTCSGPREHSHTPLYLHGTPHALLPSRKAPNKELAQCMGSHWSCCWRTLATGLCEGPLMPPMQPWNPLGEGSTSVNSGLKSPLGGCRYCRALWLVGWLFHKSKPHTYSCVHLFCKHLPNTDSVSSSGLRPRQTMNAQQVCTPCYDLRTWNGKNRRWRWHCWCFPYSHYSRSPRVSKV